MDVMLETLRTTYGVERAVPELKYAREDVMFELYRRDLRALPGAQEILQMAQALGVPVAVASGMSLRIINTVLEIMGWDHFVRATASTHESQRSKPAPDVFLLAATRLGVEPSRCIVLENDANGYRAAIAAGMACYPIPHTPKQREGLEAIGVPKIYGSLHEVIEVIRPLLV